MIGRWLKVDSVFSPACFWGCQFGQGHPQLGKKGGCESRNDHMRCAKVGCGCCNGQSAHVDEGFIGGLTYAQYFGLSEAEQEVLWEQPFTDTMLDSDLMNEVELSIDGNRLCITWLQ